MGSLGLGKTLDGHIQIEKHTTLLLISHQALYPQARRQWLAARRWLDAIQRRMALFAGHPDDALRL